jgi:hypothetical protein
MKSKTIEALRVLAKQLGLTGYSKLRKDELLKLITAGNREARTNHAARSRNAVSRTTTVQKKSRRAPKIIADRAPAKPSPVPPTTALAQFSTDVEQQVESAKYAFAPPGTNLQEPAYAADLGEDIGHLPAIRESLLCLLPQKPGVLHGYWVLPPASLAAQQSIRLRLAHYAGDHLAILGEHPVPTERGHWYFHVGEDIELSAVYLQLGRYQANGEFVSIIQRSIARIPSLYASAQTDRRWWVSDSQFRAMYQRTGGVEHGALLGWGGSASSPGGPLRWLGNISSQR